MKSQPITISRYSNGTLVKLNVTDSAFVSYDYNPETDAATYIPNTITITPTFSGGVKFGKWRYSTNGANFYDVVSGQHGFTTSGNALVLSATSDLYKTTNSAVIVACYGDNPLYYDTVTIMRYVDPTFVYKKTSTAIKQTNDKISLIATEEQLAKYGSKFTVLDDLQAQIDVIPSKISLAVKEEHGIITGEMNTALSEYATLEEMESQLELTSQSITSSVSKTYQTKSDSVAALNEAKEYTDNAEQDANDYTDGKVQNVAADLRSEIKQSADNITSTVSATYQTKKAAASDLSAAKAYADEVASDATVIANGKTTAYYQTSAPTGAREGDLWIDTDDGNSLHRYNGSNWITIDNTKIQKALTDAADAQSTADKKIITFAQTSQPTATGVGDLWIDTDDDNKLYRWNGSAWTAYRDGAIAKAETSAKNYADSKDVTLKSEIKQTTDAISSTVSKKVGKDEIISSINQSAESIKINANKVNITGFVTFDNLKNSGETTINGSNITTGIIHDANDNMVLDLSTGAITAKKLSVTSTYFTLQENGYCYWGGTTGSKIGIENGIIKGYWNNKPNGGYIDCTSYEIRASRLYVVEGASSNLRFHQVATTTETVVTGVSNGNDIKEDVIGSVSLNAGSCTAQTTTIHYKDAYGGNAWTTVVTGINYRAPYLQSSSKSVVTASGKASGSTKTIRVFYGVPIERHLIVNGGIVTTFT